MKTITPEQIQSVLNAFYGTNISAKDFDIIKDFFGKLPDDSKDDAPNPKAKKDA